jgi:hypothetical protein
VALALPAFTPPVRSEPLPLLLDRAGVVIVNHGDPRRAHFGKTVAEVAHALVKTPARHSGKAPSALLIDAYATVLLGELMLQNALRVYDESTYKAEVALLGRERERWWRGLRLFNRTNLARIWRARHSGYEMCRETGRVAGMLLRILGLDIVVRLFIAVMISLFSLSFFFSSQDICEAVAYVIWSCGSFGVELFFGTAVSLGRVWGDTLAASPRVVFDHAAAAIADATGSEAVGDVSGVAAVMAAIAFPMAWVV